MTGLLLTEKPRMYFFLLCDFSGSVVLCVKLKKIVVYGALF